MAIRDSTSVVRRSAGGRVDGGDWAEASARLGLRPGELRMLWLGPRHGDPDRLSSEGAEILARVRGGDRIAQALRSVEGPPTFDGPAAGSEEGPSSAPEESERARAEAEIEGVEQRLSALADVPERLRRLEEEIASLRADAMEVEGDLEAETADWLRHRQDAETHLESYRSRARELRDRRRELEEAGPDGTCPFCRRPLGDRYGEVVSELRDEWERLVQDGSWWRRRRDQLQAKPPTLRQLENRSRRLRAELEERAERLERRRFELRERDELRERRVELLEALGRSNPRGPDASKGAGRRALIATLRSTASELVAEERAVVVVAAGFILNRISGGRLLGMSCGEGGETIVVEDGRPRRSLSPGDRAAVLVALRLALAHRVVRAGVPLESVVLGGAFGRLDADARVRTLDLLRDGLEWIPQVLIVAADDAVRASPERFDRIVELRPGPEGGARLRTRPGGVARLRLVPPSSSSHS